MSCVCFMYCTYPNSSMAHRKHPVPADVSIHPVLYQDRCILLPSDLGEILLLLAVQFLHQLKELLLAAQAGISNFEGLANDGVNFLRL